MLSAARECEIKNFLKELGIKADNYELFNTALTHPSFNYESNIENGSDYERLEFLGDSVLRLSVSTILFDEYTDYQEGKLTKIRSYLVSDKFLASIAKKINLSQYINIGKHEEKDGGRDKDSILACSLEAVFGAIYQCSGYKSALKFITKLYKNECKNAEEILCFYNPKEILQQYTQGINKDLPIYEIVNETGKAHNKTYEVSVSYNGKKLGVGSGKTKKEAEKNAAYSAIKSLNISEGMHDE